MIRLLFFTILTTLFISGCSLDLSDKSNNSPTENCGSDYRGSYGDCISFADEYLVGGIWTIYDGNGTTTSPELKIIFDENGEARYCYTGCTNFENYNQTPWVWRKVGDLNLTMFNLNLPESIEKQYVLYSKNPDGTILFLEDHNTTKTFSKF